jgi:hypothetical protein
MAPKRLQRSRLRPASAVALAGFDLHQRRIHEGNYNSRVSTTGVSIMGDSQLRQDVLDELEFEPSIDAVHIGVAVHAGVVTLTGHVGSYAEKLAAVTAVRRVKGVRAIADEIHARYPSAKKTADDEIAKRAVDILRWDTMVPS